MLDIASIFTTIIFIISIIVSIIIVIIWIYTVGLPYLITIF
jgi:hypothetical protein